MNYDDYEAQAQGEAEEQMRAEAEFAEHEAEQALEEMAGCIDEITALRIARHEVYRQLINNAIGELKMVYFIGNIKIDTSMQYTEVFRILDELIKTKEIELNAK